MLKINTFEVEKRMAQLGLDKNELAAKYGCKRQWISLLFKQNKRINTKTMNKLAQALETDPVKISKEVL